MRLLLVRDREALVPAVEREGSVALFRGGTRLRDLLTMTPSKISELASDTRDHLTYQDLERSRAIAPPVPGGAKIVAVSKNYRDFLVQAGLEVPTEPVLFAKYPNTVIGSGDPIRLPRLSERVGYEAELAVVIGRRCRDLEVGEAMECVWGYTVVNDITAVDILKMDGNLLRAKNFDSFLPTGPGILPASELGDPSNVRITLSVNGNMLQDGSTADMVFDVAQLVSHISKDFTLDVGDVIATGTPGGTAAFHSPPAFLKPGDVVSARVAGVGILTNPVVRQNEEAT